MNNMKTILNLTQHPATAEQSISGVVDLPAGYAERLKKLITFDDLPTADEVKKRAEGVRNLIVEFAKDPTSPVRDEIAAMVAPDGTLDEAEFRKLDLSFMIGGAPFFMPALEMELAKIGTPMYAFSKRKVVEKADKNGEVKKVSVFIHEGFVKGIVSNKNEDERPVRRRKP